MNDTWRKFRRELLLIMTGACALTAVSHAQSRDLFRHDFGRPLTETYRTATNDILVAVQFNDGGEACRIMVFPEANSYYPLTGVTQEALDAVTYRFIPEDKGKAVGGGLVNGSCGEVSCSGNFQEYENL